jgi:hypothetical protein
MSADLLPSRPERIRDRTQGDRRLLMEGSSEQDLAVSALWGAAELCRASLVGRADQHLSVHGVRCAVQGDGAS